MEKLEMLALVQLGVSVVIMGYGAYLDYRTRKVPNKYWILLSLAAVALLVVRILLEEAPLEYLLVLVPIAAVLSDVYLDYEGKGPMMTIVPVMKYAVAVLSVLTLAVLWGDDNYFVQLLTAPVMMLLIVVMYMLDLIRGGADAKALIALSVMFPFYPVIGGFPLIGWTEWYAGVVFPFAFVVLLNGAIMVALLPIAFFLRNLASGDTDMPYAFLGYKLRTEDAKGRFVWLMERIEEGQHRRFSRPKRMEDLPKELDLLAQAGHDRVWVTPKVPFIIPLFFSLLFSSIVGNILLLLTPL